MPLCSLYTETKKETRNDLSSLCRDPTWGILTPRLWTPDKRHPSQARLKNMLEAGYVTTEKKLTEKIRNTHSTCFWDQNVRLKKLWALQRNDPPGIYFYRGCGGRARVKKDNDEGISKNSVLRIEIKCQNVQPPISSFILHILSLTFISEYLHSEAFQHVTLYLSKCYQALWGRERASNGPLIVHGYYFPLLFLDLHYNDLQMLWEMGLNHRNPFCP